MRSKALCEQITSGDVSGCVAFWFVKSPLSPGALLAVLYFSSCHIFFRPFRLFLVPTICPWVSEDELSVTGQWVCSADIFQVYLASFIVFFSIVLRDCGDPGKPDNAIVIMGNHWAGGYIRYLCNPGYTMIGPAVRRCLPSGQWSGNTPTCKNVNSMQSTSTNVCFLSKKKSRIT